MIERAGLNVDQLLNKLNKALAAEITTYYYTVLRNHVVGEDLKEITEDARLEDRLHFEALVPRVYELGGDIYRDMKDLLDDAACSAAYLPKGITFNTVHNDATNKRILKVLLDAERYAVRVYTEICNMTFGKDPRTYDLALAILHEEIEHESWFEEMLEEFRSSPDHKGCTDCLLAGLQITEGTGKPVLHPLHLLARAYGLS